MKFILYISLLLLSLNAYGGFFPMCNSTPSTGSKIYKPLEFWPWPWGSECPFPWGEVEGFWQVNEVGDFIELRVVSRGKTGERFLKITHFAKEGFELAKGYGYAAPDHKIITASLNYKVRGQSVDFWVYVRSYTDSGVCRKENRIMAITFRPADKCDGLMDQHYTLNKVRSY